MDKTLTMSKNSAGTGSTWKKLGRLAIPRINSLEHATLPTPLVNSIDGTLDLYFSVKDIMGRSLPYKVKLDRHNPLKILELPKNPLLALGQAGDFDDNGCVVSSVVNCNESILLYYVGFEIPSRIRYRMFTGLAISEDGGVTFKKISRTPILDRTNSEAFFRCGPQVIFKNNTFNLYYVAGSDWVNIHGKEMPKYDLRILTSPNGIEWGSEGRVILKPEKDEYSLGRPWVFSYGDYEDQMLYSARKIKSNTYNIEMTSLANDSRKKVIGTVGLSEKISNFDDEMTAYASTYTSPDNELYLFYNGNNFGETGIGVAKYKT